MSSPQPAPARQAPPVEDPWLTVDEATTHSRHGRRTIERALADGTLRSARPTGGKHLIRRSWIDAWILGEPRTSTTEPAA